MLSANSLTGHLGWAIGAVGLGVVADAAGLSIGILAGAVLLAIAAPLYPLAAVEAPPPDRPAVLVGSRPVPLPRSGACTTISPGSLWTRTQP